jgi:N-alpha-acetyl-L-2,4-diaminobutyrate deacetylase
MVDGVTATLQTRTTLRATVDFDKPGKQLGFIEVPHSVHDDAWGIIRVPIAVIGSGPGPTVILEGGNHGDEYEGPIVLGELIRTLDPGVVSGRLIFIPAINLPAVAAGRRTSPLDDLNFNRAFPGDPLGSPTQQIVAFVNDVLFPLADAFLDLHSGGSSLAIIPSAIIEPVADTEGHARNQTAALAFGAPMTVAIDNRGDPRTATASAARAGLTVVGTEMAGGGTVSMDALAICRRGVRNVLAHLGSLPPEMSDPPQTSSPIYDLPGSNAYVLATDEGVFEPFHANGTVVRAGQPAGRIHFLVDPSRPPVELAYEAEGILYGRRQPGKVRPGNCCLVVARPLGAA